jgi:hypothetical protein
METTLARATGKSKSGIERRNKKEASKWFQNLSLAEQSLLKQQQANSSSSSLKERKPKKEMHQREHEMILQRRSEHEARMKAQLKSKAEITQQIQKCQQLRRQLIPFQMRLEQMQMHGYYCASTSELFYNLGNLDSKVSNELRIIKNEEKVLFDMQHKHHCIKNSITDIIKKTKTIIAYWQQESASCGMTFSQLSITKKAKKYVDNVYKLVTV